MSVGKILYCFAHTRIIEVLWTKSTFLIFFYCVFDRILSLISNKKKCDNLQRYITLKKILKIVIFLYEAYSRFYSDKFLLFYFYFVFFFSSLIKSIAIFLLFDRIFLLCNTNQVIRGSKQSINFYSIPLCSFLEVTEMYS